MSGGYMKNNVIKLSVLCFLIMCSAVVMAAPKAKVLEYGYYKFTEASERRANEMTTSGYVTRGAAKLVKETERIPLERGQLFGFRFKIFGMNESVGVIPLELVVTHPEMKKPDGSLSTGYKYKMELSLSNGEVEDKTGYRVNEAFEMVEGDWIFEYRFMNKTLIKRNFTTYLPTEVAQAGDASSIDGAANTIDSKKSATKETTKEK